MEKIKNISKQKTGLLLVLAILLIVTIICRFSRLDLIIQSQFYSDESVWFLVESKFWNFFYKIGIVPGFLLALSGLAIISLSYWRSKFRPWRKSAVMILFVFVVAPGLIINLTFKEHWGRPRPRETVDFTGKEKFHYVWEKGKTGNGKSFPCGHCSMGFIMAIPYLFLRKKHKSAAYAFLLSGLVLGILIGMARITAGGHYFSDVIWSGGFVWLTAIGAYYWIKPNKPLPEPKTDKKSLRKTKILAILMGAFLPVIIVGLLLATPYISSKEFKLNEKQLQDIKNKTITFDLFTGNIEIRSNKSLTADYRINGFGFPNSKVRINWHTEDSCIFKLEKLGWFTEVTNNMNINLPYNNNNNYNINIGKGNVFFYASNDTNQVEFTINIKKGNLELFIDNESDIEINYTENEIKNRSGIKKLKINNNKITLGQKNIKINAKLHNGSLIINKLE